MSLCLATLCVAALSLPHVSSGDKWVAERTIHFVSSAAGIDMQNDDRFEYEVLPGGRSLVVKRRQTGTHLTDAVFLPAPSDGEAAKQTVAFDLKGGLKGEDRLGDDLEAIFTSLYVAAWNGSGSSDKHSSIEVKVNSDLEEHLHYEQSAVEGPETIDGTVKLDPVTHLPTSMSLMGSRVMMPGGGERVSVRIEYSVKKRSGK